MDRIEKPNSIIQAEQNYDYSQIPELMGSNIGDSDLEFWNKYKKRVNIGSSVLQLGNQSHKARHGSNLRNLDNKADGDLYYLLFEHFKSGIKKITRGITEFYSDCRSANGPIYNDYRGIGHLICGKDKKRVRLSSCMYHRGLEVRIPCSEVAFFEKADYYFFEQDGLFLLFNIKNFLKLNNTQKWLTMEGPTQYEASEYANKIFVVDYLFKFGCIDYYGYSNGEKIWYNRGDITFKGITNYGKSVTKSKKYQKTWMIGCKSSLDEPRYISYRLPNDFLKEKDSSKEYIKSLTAGGFMENLTDKNGKTLTRQTFATQARTNTKNFLKGKIPQKLSLAYYGKTPHVILDNKNGDINEEKVKKWLIAISESLYIRKFVTRLNHWLKEKNKTKQTMTLGDFFDFVDKDTGGGNFQFLLEEEYEKFRETKIYKIRSDKSTNYYKSEIAYYANRKRGFIKEDELYDIMKRILMYENDNERDFYSIYLSIKGKKLKNNEKIKSELPNSYLFLFNHCYPLDKTIIFSNLKIYGSDDNNISNQGGP